MYSMYRQCVAVGGGAGWGVFNCVIDHNLQEFLTLCFWLDSEPTKLLHHPKQKLPVKTTFRDWCLKSSLVHGLEERKRGGAIPLTSYNRQKSDCSHSQDVVYSPPHGAKKFLNAAYVWVEYLKSAGLCTDWRWMTQLFVPIVGGEFMCCATVVARSFFYNSLFPHRILPFF